LTIEREKKVLLQSGKSLSFFLLFCLIVTIVVVIITVVIVIVTVVIVIKFKRKSAIWAGILTIEREKKVLVQSGKSLSYYYCCCYY